ncbi:MAG TPA: hypothetical protein PKC87_05915 [Candidatus Absconditabacterales bacterium]|nr:hypothetical protein [Candidatus Absconditabacterales bacterium]
MSTIKYTKEQREILLGNTYVKKCSEKYITFTDAFKLLCIEQDALGILPREIFSLSGFPEHIVTSLIPKRCLGRWRMLSRAGKLIGNKKGKKKQETRDISKMTKDEYIRYLEAQVAAMNEVQEFLKKRKGKYP